MKILGRDVLVGKHEIPADLKQFFEPAECGKCYVCRMVEAFREVRRVLRSDGTCWVNMGDSYTSGGRKERDLGQSKLHPAFEGDAFVDGLRPDTPAGLKPKDLVGIPWMLAFALRADGWWLRQDIVWAKPNPMPESVTDRCTRSHEYIFLLSKSPRYYYDAAAIAEPASDPDLKRFTDGGKDKQRGHERRHEGFNGRYAKKLREEGVPTTRNKRDVWWVSPYPFPEAHFATFPPKLIEPCILAGCPPGGLVLDPFAGSGTTLMVANSLGRRAVGIELQANYLPMIQRRVESVSSKEVVESP